MSYCFQLCALALNLFAPCVFWLDEHAAYHEGFARNINLLMQVLMFLLASLYSLRTASQVGGRQRSRYRASGFFGAAMAASVSVQVAYPLMPLYSVGCMLGISALHTFVVEDEREESRKELKEALDRLRQQQIELDSTKTLAYTDALTGAKSKYAYQQATEELDRLIDEGVSEPFAAVVFDVNGLKRINDSLGHSKGDAYLKRACTMMCTCFKRSPAYRIGGDEFVAILRGGDYDHCDELLDSFVRQVDENQESGDGVVVASGMGEYASGEQNTYQAVFERADAAMYERKHALKRQGRAHCLAR